MKVKVKEMVLMMCFSHIDSAETDLCCLMMTKAQQEPYIASTESFDLVLLHIGQQISYYLPFIN